MANFSNRVGLSAHMLFLFQFLLSACTTTSTGSSNVLRDSSLPQYAGVAEVPMESIQVGENREFVVGKLGVGQFPWGRSHSFGLRLPASNKTYYLVVKSYFVSTATHFRYASDKSAGFWEPRVVFPYVVFLDREMNIIGNSRINDFQVNSDIHTDLLRSYVGESWVQAAFEMNKTRFPGAYYAVVSTSSDFVGKVGAVSNFYWPFGAGYWFPLVVYAPILDPMPSYAGPMIPVRYGHVGDIQVQAVAPKELLSSASYGRKISKAKSETVAPGTLLKEKTLLIRSPGADGYEMVESSTSRTVYVAFSKRLPDGRGDVAMFAQSFKMNRAISNVRAEVQDMVKNAVKEHSIALRDLKFHANAVPSTIGYCERLDFEGTQPRSYLAKIKGYDVLCLATEQNLSVRIGASILTSPAYTLTEELPVEAVEFLNGISLAQ